MRKWEEISIESNCQFFALSKEPQVLFDLVASCDSRLHWFMGVVELDQPYDSSFLPKALET